MDKFTYNKVENDFSFGNLTQDLVSFFKDCLFLVIPSCKTNQFRQGIILTILAASDKICIVMSFNNLLTPFLKINN